MNEDKKADNNKQIKYPKTIKVEKSDIQNEIELDGLEFLALINNDKINVVFIDFSWNRFFIVKEGCRFYTDPLGFEEFEEYYKKLEHLKKEGITEPEGYKEALRLGINNYEQYKVYTSYKASDFKDLEQYVKATKLGFQDSNEYKEAIELGIDNYEDYTSFVESGFYSNNGYRYNRHVTKQNVEIYKEYLKAKKLGFQDKNEYYEAMELGFSNAAQYQEFLESGCETKEEFEFLKKMPQIIKNMNKKINKIVKDADNAFKSNQFEEFIRLKFLSIEKIADMTHLKVFKREKWEGEDLKVDNIINEIERELNLELTDHEELKYWRRIRNKIIHEHLKIEKDKAEKGKEFFDELYNNLKKYS